MLRADVQPTGLLPASLLLRVCSRSCSDALLCARTGGDLLPDTDLLPCTGLLPNELLSTEAVPLSLLQYLPLGDPTSLVLSDGRCWSNLRSADLVCGIPSAIRC